MVTGRPGDDGRSPTGPPGCGNERAKRVLGEGAPYDPWNAAGCLEKRPAVHTNEKH